tara:strand:+ start:73464 stop:76610 length:3147 start_codon:yes stop_codon:yes gene_type:complete
MKKVIQKIFTLIFLLQITLCIAQTRKITGVVQDESQNPLPGVSILIKNTTKGLTTDFDGNFSIEVKEGDVLLFSYVGMKEQEIVIKKQTNLKVILVNANQLDEIVIVGYGSSKKKDLTGSVSRISAKEFEGQNVSTADQLLQGRIAGVQVVGGSGSPGEALKIQIRGANSLLGSNTPLYVIDGVPITSENAFAENGLEGDQNSSNSNIMSLIDPSQIESIDVLKDASATAIYGSQGANGVIIITTKKPVSGKARIQVTSKVTFNTVEKFINLEEPWQFAEDWNEATNFPGSPVFQYDGTTNVEGVYFPGVEEIRSNPDQWGVDWQDEIFDNTITTNQSVSISDKIGNSSYNISYSTLDDTGILIDTRFKRNTFTARINSSKWNNKLKYGANVYYSKTAGNNKSNSGGNSFNVGVINNALSYNNVFPVYDENGDYFVIQNPDGSQDNLNHPLNYLKGINDLTEGKYLIISGFADLKLLNNLNFKSTINSVVNNSNREVYWPRSNWRGVGFNGIGSVTIQERTKMVYENYFTYNKRVFQDHSLNAVVGFSYQEDTSKRINATSSNFQTDDLGIKDISSGQDPFITTDSYINSQLMSYYARLNYKIKDRYLFTFTGRADGSSKFGNTNKWGYFPSGAFAWRISEEEFMQNISNKISDLKFRASYGVTGSQAIGAYQSIAALGTTGYYFGDSYTVGNTYNSIQNPGLKWETTYSWDIGFDLSLFDDKIKVVVDWYNKDTKDLLWRYQVARETGFDVGTVNLGEINNSGLEVTISGAPINNGTLKWDTNISYTRNRNKVVEFINPESSDDLLLGTPLWGGKMYPNVFQEGQPLGMFYGWRTDGIIQTQAEADAITYSNGWRPPVPGEIKFVDLDGNGVINDEDRTLIGDPNPDFLLNWNNSVSFKNWQMSFNFNYVHGVDIFNITGARLMENRGNGVGSSASNDQWSAFNPSNEFPIIDVNRQYDNAMIDRYIEDGTYLRLKTLSLGYNFGIKKIKWLNWLKMNLAVNNVFTITNYSGYNPDVSSFNSNEKINWDSGSLPSNRAYTFTVQFGL